MQKPRLGGAVLPLGQFTPHDLRAEVLIMAAEGRGPVMHARIDVLRALNRHVERLFNPDRKEHHWGRRKLKRDL
jgi:hypothetical protein